MCWSCGFAILPSVRRSLHLHSAGRRPRAACGRGVRQAERWSEPSTQPQPTRKAVPSSLASTVPEPLASIMRKHSCICCFSSLVKETLTDCTAAHRQHVSGESHLAACSSGRAQAARSRQPGKRLTAKVGDVQQSKLLTAAPLSRRCTIGVASPGSSSLFRRGGAAACWHSDGCKITGSCTLCCECPPCHGF